MICCLVSIHFLCNISPPDIFSIRWCNCNRLQTENGESGTMGHPCLCGQFSPFLPSCLKLIASPWYSSIGEYCISAVDIWYSFTVSSMDWSDSLTPAIRMTASVRLTSFRTIMVDLCVWRGGASLWPKEAPGTRKGREDIRQLDNATKWTNTKDGDDNDTDARTGTEEGRGETWPRHLRHANAAFGIRGGKKNEINKERMKETNRGDCANKLRIGGS